MNTNENGEAGYALDWLKWSMVAVLAIASYFILQMYPELSDPVKMIVFIGWLLLSLAIIYFTKLGQDGLSFASEARAELLKVVWPTKQETVQTTIIIMVMVFVVSLILWGVDSGLLWLVGKLTSLK